MTATTVFALRKGEMLTLESSSRKGLHGEFIAQENNTWLIRMLPAQLKKLHTGEHFSISFARGQLMYLGDTELLTLDDKSCICHFQVPASLDSRPLRRLPRIASDFAAALIYSDSNAPQGRRKFSTRDQNRVLDLNTQGARIACKQALGNIDDEVVLVTCFDANPNLANAQVYYHARIIRQIDGKAPVDFPYVYGLEFRPLQAECEQALENYLAEMIGEPAYLKEA